MGLFKKKKKEEIADFLEELESPKKEQVPPQRRAEHEALAYCEQIMNAARDLEEGKKEYQLVTEYLSDIQMLEELPEDKMSRITEMAQNLVNLNQSNEEFTGKKKQISDAQYTQMEQLAEEVPDDIRRMQTNENYQAMVKRDMDYLEGEKGEWHYYLESVRREQFFVKCGVWAVAGLFVAALIVLGVTNSYYHFDLMLPLLGTVFAAAMCGGGIFLRMQYNRREMLRAEANINRAITLLNQMKAKYVNVTNAVDYATEKFHVRNSMELNFIWEQYMEAAREREVFEQNNEDLEYFNGRLVRELKNYQLYDASIWIHQAHALVDRKEMVELKHFLLVRRQKLRGRLEFQIKEIQEAKKMILRLLKDKKEYRKEIVEVLKSVDKMCGLK